MIRRCIRCGNWIRAERLKTGYHMRWGEIAQHERCARMFRGTDVHWIDNPHPLAASESFTYNNGDGTFSLYVIAPILENLCIQQRRPWVDATIPLHVSKAIMEKNEVAEDDARAVYKAREAEGTHDMPIILVELPDGRNFPIDGSHRIAYAYLTRRESIAAWVVEKAETDPYRIDKWDPSIGERCVV